MTDDNRQDPWLRENPYQKQNEPTTTGASGDGRWERDVIERLAFSALREQRRARRWGIFFKLLMFAYLIVLFISYMPGDWSGDGLSQGRHTALVDVRGVIADNEAANAESIISGLRAAFENKNTAGVILRVNSPGGSPVQAGYVNDEIFSLRKKYPKIPVYAVITDICASGGYYIASAADKIYADKASVVGSIGVLMNGFGFVETMKKLGVERRLITAGKHKGFMDPFSPLKASDRKYIHQMLDDIHRQFIATVRKGRGDRLQENDTLFSGLVWTGEQGIKLGLVDALGSTDYVARKVIGAAKIVNYTRRRPYLERLAERLGTGATQALGNLFASRLQ